MQIVSGPIYKPTVHFEAPSSKVVCAELQHFISWFNDTAPHGRTPLPTLTRAGLVHLYFVWVHPFKDGNGRIGRALAEKSFAQNLGHPSLIALAYTIERKRGHLNERQAKVVTRCLKRVSMGSKEAFQLKTISRLREPRGPAQPAIFKTSWRKVRSPKLAISGTQDIS